MESSDHISPDELELLVDLPAADPRRRHVEECAACRARWLDYMSLISREPLPPEADEAGAHERLEEFIRREIGGEAAAPPASRVVRGNFGRWALAIAAVAAVAVGLWRLPPRPNPVPVRGGPSAVGPVVALEPFEPGEGGASRLRWQPVPGATRYEVHFFRADLSEALCHDAGVGTSVLLTPELLAPAGPAGSVTMLRVEAYRDAIRLAESGFAHLTAH